MVTKAKKALLASLAAFLCVMLTVFGLSMSVSLSETAKAADETSAVAQVGKTTYGTLNGAIGAAAEGDTVTLLKDTTENVVVDKDITLDLNGFTLNGGTGTAKAAITNKGTLTIKDSSAAKTGTIKRNDNGVEGETSYYVIRNLGTMTIEQANVVNNSGYRKTNPSGSMIGSSLICNGDNDEGASLTINGGKLTQLNFLAVKNGANGTLFVNGGEITSNHSAIQNWYNATITGGTIKGQLWTDAYIAGESVGNTVIDGDVKFTGEIVMDVYGSIEPKLTINGGNLSVTNWRITTACAKLGGKPAVQGGTFTKAVPAEYCAEGFVPTEIEAGKYGVKAEPLTFDEDGICRISTEAELKRFAAMVNAGDNFAGKTVYLENDIDLNNKLWTPIGVYNDSKTHFKGTFDGQNHTITGLKVNESRKNGVGFFGKVSTGTIKNLTVEGTVSVSGCNYVGGIVGHGYATITNCTFKGTVGSKDTMQVGGIAGSGGFTITNCSVYGNVIAECWAGGIVGNCQDGGAYTNCYVDGTISSERTYWGGGAAGITPVPLYPSQVISQCYSDTVVKVAGEEVNCPIIASYNNPLDYNGYTGDLKIYDNSWNKAKNSNDSYPIYAEKNGEGGVLEEGKDVSRDNTLIMLEGDLNYIDRKLPRSKIKILPGSAVTSETLDNMTVAAIGKEKYFSLEAAIAAAKDGETVKLLADVEQNSEVSINKNITLDLNGKKIYNTKDIWHDTDPVIVSLIAIKDGAEVTVMGDGTIAAKANDCYTFVIVDGELTIENGTFVGNVSVVQVEKGTLTINGGTFSLLQKWKGEDRYLINCIDKAFTDKEAKVAIYGGSFVGFDPNVSPEKKVDGKAPSFAAPGVGITKNENGSFTAKANMAAQILDSDGNSVEAYATLAEAIAAAKDGETVKLLADITENGMDIAKSITIDFDGHTLTVEGEMVGSSGTVTNALRFLKNGDTTNTVVLKNGKIVSTTARILIQNYSSLTVDGMVLDLSGQQLYGYVLSNNNGNTVIKDTTISAPAAERSLAFDVCGFSTYGDVSVTMEGNCVINGNVMFSTDNPKNKQNVELILNGGIINGSLVDGGGSEDIIIRKSDNVDIAAPAGYFWNSEGVLKIAVAKIGEKNYATLQEAFDAAKTGDIVKLLTDITLTAQVNITKALNGLTLDGNGKTITCATTNDVFASGGSALYFGNATDKLYCTGIKIKDLTMTGKARFAIFLCGGTTTEFTNVNISGEYYIAVNLYGTHGATMTNCTISNSTIGTDEYISGVWSNVASANPLRLVSTTVDVIAINTYTTANTLAPKIFIDKNSSAEVHTFDDGSVSYNKKLCVSTESEGSYTVKEYFNSEWVDTYVAEVKGVKYETLQAAIEAAARTTVKLLANTRENITITEALTLDLNGYTINGGTEKGKPAVTVKARVTIKDSSADQTGTIMREDTAGNSGVSSHYVIDVQDGWLTFEGGKVINNSGNVAGKGASLVRVGDDSVAKFPGLNIKGGTFTQDNFIVIKVDCGDLFLNGGTLNSANSYAIENWHRATVKGGTVNGDVAAWTYSGGLNSDLTISGGTIKGNVESVSYDGAAGKLAKVSITGGTVTGTLSNKVYSGSSEVTTAMATIEVSGGTFSVDPTKYVVEDSAITENADGTFGVKKAYLVRVGNTSYYTMDEAFKAQTASGEAIVMLRDYTTGSTFNSGSIHRVVDLNGHTWTYTGTDTNSAAFEINYSNATLTVKNGTIISSTIVGLIPSAMGGTIKYDNSGIVFDTVIMTSNGSSGIETNGNNTNDSVTLKNSTLNVPNGFGIYFPSSGTLTIDNSKINAKTMGVQVCSGKLNINAGSAITVTGDAVPKAENDGAIQDGAAISIVNRTGYKGLSNIVITGGTFTAKAGNDAIKAYDWNNAENKGSDFTKADLVAVSGGTFSSEVNKDYLADRFVVNKNTDGTYGVTAGSGFAGANVVVTESLAMKVTIANGTASKYVVVTYKGLDGIAKTVRLDKFTDIKIEGKDYKYCLFDQIMPQMIDVKFSFELYGENDVMLDRKANYSVVDYLADIIASEKDSAEFRNVAASLIEYANRAKVVKGLTTTVAPTFVDKAGKTVTLDYNKFVDDNKIPAKDTLGAISKGDGQVIYQAKVVFDDAYTLTFYTNDNEKQYTYKLDDKVIVFDENGEYTVNVLAQNITTKYVLTVYDKDSKLVQTVTYGVSTYCIRMQETETPQGELYVASYYYGVAVNQYGTANPNSVQG